MKFTAAFISFIFFILLFQSPGFSKTIRKNDIIYGKDNSTPQFCLSRWNSELKWILSNHGVESSGIKKVKELLTSFTIKFNARKTAEAYCTLGYIGNDLYFIIKNKSKLQENDNDEFILLERIKPEQNLKTSGNKKAEEYVEKTDHKKSEILSRSGSNIYKFSKKLNLISPDDLAADLSKLFEIGNGYSIAIEISINGTTLTEVQKKCIEDIVYNTHENIRDTMRKKVRNIAEDIASQTGEIQLLNVLISKNNNELLNMVRESAVGKKIENDILLMLQNELKENQTQQKLEVKSSIEYLPSELRITKSGVMLYLAGGSDVSTYRSITAKIKNLDNIISNIMIHETALRKVMDKSVDNFIEQSDKIVAFVEDIYSAGSIDEKSNLKSIIDKASVSESAHQKKFAEYLQLRIIGSTPKNSDGEQKRLMYKTYLKDTITNLNYELTGLIASEQDFKSSGIMKSSKFKPEFQKLKKHCTDVLEILNENLYYCEQVNKKLTELDVTVSGNTTLEKLKIIRLELNEAHIKKSPSDGRIILKKAASNLRNNYLTINKIYAIVESDIW